MDKEIIKKNLIENHSSFIDFVFSLTESDFSKCKDGKWTAGQQLEHIYLSVKPVSQILAFPKFLLKIIWGSANRESKTYEELVQKYLQKLENGGRATGRFIPKAVNTNKAEKIKIALNNEISDLCSHLDNFTENDLDTYILPHPLLGKLTLRELFFFTIYHVQHHEELTKQNLV
jgi:hypothetical protein